MTANNNIEIINALKVESKYWLALRKALWPEEAEEGLKSEITAFIESEEKTIAFLAKENNSHIGFIEARIKPASSLTFDQPHVFIDGWYVVEPHRNKGLGKALVNEIEKWTRQNGLNYIVSDTTEEYPISPSAHRACGFSQKENDLVFIKNIL